MENRFQHLFLKAVRYRISACIYICVCGLFVVPYSHGDGLKADTELFELGTAVGVMNLEDFGSEITYGINGTFRATENFFLQFNYMFSGVGQSAAEDSPQGAYTGKRNFRHLDLLLGYNIFQGEIFRGDYSGLSSMYVISGVGDTEFLDESSFTYVAGIGYQMALLRRLTLRLDYRHYFYDSIIVDQQKNGTNNTHFSVGTTWLF